MKDAAIKENMLESKTSLKEIRSSYSCCIRRLHRSTCSFILIGIIFIILFTIQSNNLTDQITTLRNAFGSYNIENEYTPYQNTTEVSPYTLQVRQNIHYYLNDTKALLDSFHPFNNGTNNYTITVTNNYTIVPNFHVAYCPISEALSTTLNNIFCYLFDSDGFVQDGSDIIMNYDQPPFCDVRNQVGTIEDLNRIMPFTFNTLTVIRDPIYRFVSAFIRYCIKNKEKTNGKDNWNEICYYCEESDLICVIERLYKNVANLDTFWQNRLTIKYVFNIWAPQSWNCAMSFTYSDLTFVRYGEDGEERERMLFDIMTELERFKVPEEYLSYIQERINVGMHTMTSLRSQPEAKKVLQQLKSNSTLFDILTAIYRYDFKIFAFEKPDRNKLI